MRSIKIEALAFRSSPELIYQKGGPWLYSQPHAFYLQELIKQNTVTLLTFMNMWRDRIRK